jgi:hypothetical protein
MRYICILHYIFIYYYSMFGRQNASYENLDANKPMGFEAVMEALEARNKYLASLAHKKAEEILQEG